MQRCRKRRDCITASARLALVPRGLRQRRCRERRRPARPLQETPVSPLGPRQLSTDGPRKNVRQKWARRLVTDLLPRALREVGAV